MIETKSFVTWNFKHLKTFLRISKHERIFWIEI